MNHAGMDHGDMPAMKPIEHNHSRGAGVANVVENPTNRLAEPGIGLSDVGHRVLTYADLKSLDENSDVRKPERTLELHLTGNMERYIWSINGIKYEDADPIRLKYGERVRFKFVNETMMTHPMHLHGMWSIIDNGTGARDPIKHTINVAPGTVVYTETEVDAEGQWAFHCHLSYHAGGGMFRKVIVEGGPGDERASLPNSNGG